MRSKTSQQPLPDGEYAKEKIAFRQSCSSFVAFGEVDGAYATVIVGLTVSD